MKENRAHPRFDVSFAVQLPETAAAACLFRISDLSAGGCYVDSTAEVTVGEIVLLKISKPDSGWFEVRGLIRHCFPRLGFGLCFVNLDEQQRCQIDSLLPKTQPVAQPSDDASEYGDLSLPDGPNSSLDQIDLSSDSVM